MNYTPGLHLLAEIHYEATHLLADYGPLRLYYAERIAAYGLQAVGEVFHHFEGGGFTGVICLTESHLALHTWPEFGMLIFDVYLSNFRQVSRLRKRMFPNGGVVFFLLIVLELAFLEEGFWDALLWHDHEGVFSTFRALARVTDHTLLSFLVPALAVPQLTHYLLDGFILKLSKDEFHWRKVTLE